MTEEDGGFSLESFLTGERARVDEALERSLGQILPKLPEAVRGPASHGVRAGGKRLRPILCVAAFSACGGHESRVRRGAIYDLAVATELVHAYSLMHDDLPCMDDADLRRGRATPHTLFGEEATMVAGVALIPLAVRWAWFAAESLGLEPADCRRVIRILTHASGVDGMVGGQALDLLSEGIALSRDELDDLHRMKTGALLTAALRLGGLAAGASEKTDRALQSYGREVGLAFQIADDVLDATADQETLGKIPSDREHEKATYVALLGVEGARGEARARAEQANRALRDGAVESPVLEALAWYVVGRDR